MHDKTAPAKQLTGSKLSIQRHGNLVHLAIESRDEYAAIALFDHLVKGAESGILTLDLKAVSD